MKTLVNMKTIPFDIALRKQIQSEENHYQGRYKVQTRNGDDVRVICWDRNDKTSREFPIVGLQTFNDDIEFITSCTKDGKFSLDGKPNNNDLVLIDTWELELKESEDERIREALINYLRVMRNSGGVASFNGFSIEEYITYLEKQKDNKFAPRVLPCSAAWFEDGEDEQKEQKPMDLEKDTDFINERARMWKDYKERFDGDKIDYNHLIQHFYELGQREMRNRITNPEYNKQVVDKMKSEHPIAANEEELKKAMKERYPMPENADALTRDKIAAARNGFLSGYSWELFKTLPPTHYDLDK